MTETELGVDKPSFMTSILLSEQQIQERIEGLGREISQDYQGLDVVVVCVLKGGVLFTVDLLKRLNFYPTLDFMSVSSYGNSTVSTGEVRIFKDIEESIEGRHVLVVEDIVDTGLTLSVLLETLKLRKPSSIKLCSLLSKPSRRKVEVPIDYLGFEVEDHFVVGYGLDYENKYRNLPYIGILDPSLEVDH